MKDIKGLSERLTSLEQRVGILQQLVQDQTDMAQVGLHIDAQDIGFTRANNPILPFKDLKEDVNLPYYYYYIVDFIGLRNELELRENKVLNASNQRLPTT